jgi:hypothetical protein
MIWIIISVALVCAVIVVLLMRKSKGPRLDGYVSLDLGVTAPRAKVAILQVSSYPDGEEPIYTELGKKINEMYCKKWGYDYVFKRVPVDKMPTYWIKVYELVQLARGAYDYVVWMDLDAIVVNHEIELSGLTKYVDTTSGHDYALYVSNDEAPDVLANAGVVIVKNNWLGKKILAEWLSFCFCEDGALCNHCSSYSFEGKWKCPDCKVYARYGYEQHALGELAGKFKQGIAILHEEFLGQHQRGRANYITHLYGDADKVRYDFFQAWLEKRKCIKANKLV